MKRSTIRDYQQNRCYSWEGINVAPHDRTPVPFEQIQSVIDYVWKMEGLKFPPIIDELNGNDKACARGCRTKLLFHRNKPTPTWVLLHEASHSMSSTYDNLTNLHNSIFMGIYLQLLSRYLKLDFGQLYRSAEAYGLKVKLEARPVFL